MYRFAYFLLIIALFSITSCSSYKYIYDNDSRTLQHKLRSRRTGNAFWEGLKVAGTLTIALATNGEISAYNPDQKEFKNLNIRNTSADTLFVNMLADVKWDEEKFCDFMDLRIPPGKRCRMLVPKNTNYNIYFSKTPVPEDDEKIEINTDKYRRIDLFSGYSIEFKPKK